jgi:uncharacterized RDD family membrane protein YckC
LLGVKIVDADGMPASLGSLARRYGFIYFVYYIPLIGPIIGLIDNLFIFSKEKRCLHDYVANTIVIECSENRMAAAGSPDTGSPDKWKE